MQNIKFIHIVTIPFQLQYIKNQVTYLKKQGFEVSIVSSPGEGLIEFCKEEDVDFLAVEMPRRISLFSDLIVVYKIFKFIREKKASIVSSHTPKGGLLGMLAATLAFVPVRIYTIHGATFETAKGFKRLLLKNTEKISCMLAHKVISVGHSLRTLIINQSICSTEKITVIAGGSANGIDYQFKFNPELSSSDKKISIMNKIGLREENVVIGFIGRLANDKGIRELSIAWDTVKKKYVNAKLLLIGPFDERDGLPDTLITKFRNDDSIYLPGSIKDTQDYYSIMDIFVLPTYREGLPNVLLEASAMKIPIVATEATGCIDVVKEGVNGRLVKIKNASDLAEKLLYYLDNPISRKKHGVNGRQIIEENFGQEKNWKGQMALYKSLLKEKKVLN